MLRLDRRTTYGVLLSIVAVTILAIGYLLRPPKTLNKKTSSTASDLTAIQSEVEKLRHLAEQNQRRATSSRFAAVAGEAALHMAYAPTLQRSGIVWGKERSILLPSNSLPPPPAFPLAIGGRMITVEPSIWGAEDVFFTARTNAELGVLSVIAAPDSVPPGAWVVSVGVDQSGNAQLSPGNFGGISSLDCDGLSLQTIVTNLPLGMASVGSGLFDLDGHLIGVVAQCHGEVVTISSMDIAKILENHVNAPLLHAGIRVSRIVPQWQPFSHGSTGLIVTDVWENWPADRAGIKPGDIITSVNGKKVGAAADFSNQLESAGTAKLNIQRLGHMLTADLQTVAASNSGPPPLTVRHEVGVELSYVDPKSRAGAFGLRPGDRIISFDGSPASSAAVLQLFTSSNLRKPVLVEVRRGSRSFVSVINP